MSYNADISKDWGSVDLAGGLKMIWQSVSIKSCVYGRVGSGTAPGLAACSVYVPFREPFKSDVFYITASGRDYNNYEKLDEEGSEMNFGIESQTTIGVNVKVSRVSGENSGKERMGFVVYAIGM